MDDCLFSVPNTERAIKASLQLIQLLRKGNFRLTKFVSNVKEVLLNDKNRTIFNLKYCKGFLILVLGKRMEILYYFKPFDTKIIIRQVDYFLFLLAISSKYNFFHLFLIAVVNLVRKQLLRFYGD